MHIDDFDSELRNTCFEFFYRFSRFEFALKENGFLKKGPYRAAVPNWDEFRDQHQSEYTPTLSAQSLLDNPPQRQIYRDKTSRWEDLDLAREETDLGKVILAIKTVRNNLFHGGKSHQRDYDDPKRNLFLLTNGSDVLDSLAEIGHLEHDYWRRY